MTTANEVIDRIMRQYAGKAPLTREALKVLYARAENRGYHPQEIYAGLKVIIYKNYMRDKYIPPNNDPEQEVMHERIYIEDWEFREIMKGAITV